MWLHRGLVNDECSHTPSLVSLAMINRASYRYIQARDYKNEGLIINSRIPSIPHLFREIPNQMPLKINWRGPRGWGLKNDMKVNNFSVYIFPPILASNELFILNIHMLMDIGLPYYICLCGVADRNHYKGIVKYITDFLPFHSKILGIKCKYR